MPQTKQMTSGLYQPGGGTYVRAAYETNVKVSRNPTLANLDVSKYFLVLVSLRLGLKC